MKKFTISSLCLALIAPLVLGGNMNSASARRVHHHARTHRVVRHRRRTRRYGKRHVRRNRRHVRKRIRRRRSRIRWHAGVPSYLRGKWESHLEYIPARHDHERNVFHFNKNRIDAVFAGTADPSATTHVRYRILNKRVVLLQGRDESVSLPSHTTNDIYLHLYNAHYAHFYMKHYHGKRYLRASWGYKSGHHKVIWNNFNMFK